MEAVGLAEAFEEHFEEEEIVEEDLGEFDRGESLNFELEYLLFDTDGVEELFLPFQRFQGIWIERILHFDLLGIVPALREHKMMLENQNEIL